MNSAKVQQESFANIGDDHFEECVVRSLLLDRRFAEQMSEIIKVEYFSLDHLSFIIAKYYKYYEKHRAFPSISILITVLKDSLSSSNDSVLASSVVSFLKKIKKDQCLQDLPYVKEKSRDFCKNRAMRDALEKSIDLTATGNYGPISGIMKRALCAGEDTSVGHDYDEDTEARLREESRDPCPTGIPFLDAKDVLRGGLDKKTLGIFVAPPGIGKSHWLVQVGASAILAGYNVVHYSLEMYEEDVGRRYDAFYSGVNSREIVERADEVRDFHCNFKKNKSKRGRLIIKKYPSGFPTANTFRAHLQKLEMTKGFKPDLIIVDYADEMDSIDSHDSDSRHKFKAIYRDLRNLAEEVEVPLWSASQSNKEGSSAEIVTGENMSESFRKLDVPDIVVTGAVKPQDKSKGIMMGFVAKNRGGSDGQMFPLFVDKTTSRFQTITREEYDSLSKTQEEHKDDLKTKLRQRLKLDLKRSKDDLGTKKIEKIIDETVRP